MRASTQAAFAFAAIFSTVAPSVQGFTALCTPGPTPSGESGPNSNLLHISTWNSIEAALYTEAKHDTLWYEGIHNVASYQSGAFNPGDTLGYVSFIASQPYDPVFLTNLGDTTMRFFSAGGGIIPPGWLNFFDDCEGAGVVY